MRTVCAIGLLAFVGAAGSARADAALKGPTDPKKFLWAYIPNELFFTTCQKVVEEVGGASGNAEASKEICMKNTAAYATAAGDNADAHCTEIGAQMALMTAEGGGAPLFPIDHGVGFCGRVLEWSSFNRKTDMMTYFTKAQKKQYCTNIVSDAMGGIAPGAEGGKDAVAKNLPFACKAVMEAEFKKMGLQMMVTGAACKFFRKKAEPAASANELNPADLGAQFCSGKSIQGKIFDTSAHSPAPLGFPMIKGAWSPTVTSEKLAKMVHKNFDSFKDAFDQYDKNGDNFLDRTEWQGMCDQLKIPGKDCEALFKQADCCPADGKVSRDEWQNIVGVTLDGLRKLLLEKYGNANEGWKAGDKDGNGEMSMEEWIEHCASVGVNEGNARKLFAEVDTDDSGTIIKDEYMNVLGVDLAELKRRVRDKWGDTDKGFEAIDQDGNGQLSPEEWNNAMPLLDVSDHAAKQLFGQIDSDGNGQISKEEWDAAMGLTMEEMQKKIAGSGMTPEEVVAKMDKDGDGEVSKEDFKKALKEAGISDKDAEDLFDEMDKDGDGKITKEDWDKAAKEEADQKAAIESMDVADKDGVITKEEFMKSMEDAGVSKEEAERLWKQLDKDGDGKITKWDILNAPQSPELKDALRKVKEKMDEMVPRDATKAEREWTLEDMKTRVREIYKTTKDAWQALTDGDGKPLTMDEWKKKAADLGIPPGQAEKLFKQMDANGDGTLSEEEFQAVMGVTEDGFRQRALKKWGNADEIMKATDLNGDGKVSEEELIKAMEAVGILPENARTLAKEMMAKYDEDGDGFITGDKYREVMGAKAEDVKQRIYDKFGTAEDFFEQCDANKDGLVDEDEFVKCATEDLGISEDAARRMFEKENGGQPLNRKQFIKAFGIGPDEILERLFRYEGNPQKAFEKYDRDEDHLLSKEEIEELLGKLKLNAKQIKRIRREIDTNHEENTNHFISKWELYTYLDWQEPAKVTWGDGFGDIDPFGTTHKKFNKLTPKHLGHVAFLGLRSALREELR